MSSDIKPHLSFQNSRTAVDQSKPGTIFNLSVCIRVGLWLIKISNLQSAIE